MVTLTLKKEPSETENLHQISVPENQTKIIPNFLPDSDGDASNDPRLESLESCRRKLGRRYARAVGSCNSSCGKKPSASSFQPTPEFQVQFQTVSKLWSVATVAENMLDVVPEMKIHKLFDLDQIDHKVREDSVVRVQLRSNLKTSLPLGISCDIAPIKPADGILYAGLLLTGLYVLITIDVSFAYLILYMASVALLGILSHRPSSNEIMSWVDMETLVLLFSMMVLVSIFSESGAFDWLAVLAYRLTEGQVWPLLNSLCIFTAVLSSFLDNVTTILLMTPVTIRLCEVCELNPSPILMAMMIFSNIGGGASIVGDPPNAIIALHPGILESGVTFSTFSQHMGLGLIIVMVYVHFHLRFAFRKEGDFKFKDPQDVQELKQEIFVWKRTAASISPYTKDEDLVRGTLNKKTYLLQSELKNRLSTGSYTIPMESYKTPLEQLQKKYPIRDVPLLFESLFSFLFVISMFFLHSLPELHLSLGWIAMLGAVLLLLLTSGEKLEMVLVRIEWCTLIFFAALFVLIGALQKLGLIEWIGMQTESFILGVDEAYRLPVAISLILWVSAFVSSFLDNIPLSSMMVHIITSLANNPQLDLPLQPLVWALALGASLGGNGTLMGSSANMVCSGIAEQHGYRFTFTQYLRVGYPIMLGSVAVANIYLYLCHVCFSWHATT
ncbi:P protein-like [Diaphorina citri]|uniref:P protein-like n=2 Tax=Diaphorina citri TaxID=121845 RepID=A0A3Q0IY28_DIACI|nr:P protein-like [Diaphorina citri]